MEFAYHYGDRRKLYLNATNRCTNRCSFCVRYRVDGLGGAVLWGDKEPDFDMLRTAILHHGTLEEFQEFVWCGYGEPTFRLDLIQETAPWLRSRGATIRLNTNGHACVIHGRDVLPELAQAVDMVSISLNAPNLPRYIELCRPDLDLIAGYNCGNVEVITPDILWEALMDFMYRSPAHFKTVQASGVGYALTPVEIEQCRFLALSMGVNQFRIR
jgi:TatD DNase family protein